MLSNRKTIDLRTDTATLPTPDMYEAMAAAPLGDDGWRDDPTVLELERSTATLLGKEAALFLPSGTMADLVALMASGRRQGGELIAHEGAWVLGGASHGGYATIAGLAARPIPGLRGAMDLDMLEEAIDPIGHHRAPFTAIVAIENTHTAENGAVLSIEHMAAVKASAARKGVTLFLDGARLPHAAVALGTTLADVASYGDLVTMSLCKALGAPAGSMLAGSAEMIERGLLYRKLLGGAMRQSGLLAACALVALRTPLSTIETYHTRARRLADGLGRLDPQFADPYMTVTNLLTLDVRHTGLDAAQWVKALADEGVLVAPMGRFKLRLLTHSEVLDDDVEEALERFAIVRNRCPADAKMKHSGIAVA